jgi:hypothetical protein
MTDAIFWGRFRSCAYSSNGDADEARAVCNSFEARLKLVVDQKMASKSF